MPNKNIKHLPSYVSKVVLEIYKDEFVYVSPDNLVFHPDTSTLTGNLIYRGAPYWKRESKIFNNTEAMFAFNQAGYLLAICAFSHDDGFDIFDESFSDSIQNYIKMLGHFVIREQTLKFDGMITGNSTTVPFTAKGLRRKKTNHGHYFVCSINIGEENQFTITSKVFLLKTNVHREA